MHLIVDLAKTTLLPGSITTIIFAFTSGLVLLYARPRWGRVWLTCVTVGYWLVSTPVGTSLLARTVSTSHHPLQNAASAQGATAVVMLGGGSSNVIALGRELTSVTRSSALRAIETARVYHLLGDPLVIVSGGVTDPTPGASPESDAYQTAMHSLGVPADRVVSEGESRNTYEEVVILKRMLNDRHIDRAEIGGEGEHPVVTHRLLGQLAAVMQSDGDLLARGGNGQLLLVVLHLIIAADLQLARVRGAGVRWECECGRERERTESDA